MFRKLMEETDDIFKPAGEEEMRRRDEEHPTNPEKPEFYTHRGMAYYSVKAETEGEPSGCDFCDNWTYMQTCLPEDDEMAGDSDCYYACPDCIKRLGLPYDGPLDGSEEPVITWTEKPQMESLLTKTMEAEVFQPASPEDIKARDASSVGQQRKNEETALKLVDMLNLKPKRDGLYHTGWGRKTALGLLAAVRNIVNEEA